MKDLIPFYNKFKELISIEYCTFIILSVVVEVVVGGLLFFRIHVKGVIEFFVMQGVGQDNLFSC